MSSLAGPAFALVASSVGFVHVRLSATTTDGTAVDLHSAGLGVQIALTASVGAAAATFQTASWILDSGITFAALPITSANLLTAGNYAVYLRVAGEYVMRATGLLTVLS